MDKQMREAVEAAGFRVGDAEDFFGLTPEERQMVELRLAASRRLRFLRERKRISQQELAAKIGSSQSRVAKVEAGAEGVSLDLLFRALFAVGGKVADLASAPTGATPTESQSARVRPATKRPAKLRLRRSNPV